MVRETVIVIVKLAVLMFELLDGRSWSATTCRYHTNSFFLFGKPVLSEAFFKFPKCIWKLLFVT